MVRPLVIGHWRVRAGKGTTMGLAVRGRAVRGRGRHLRVGLAAGGDGRGRVRPLARTAKGAGVLVALVKIKFKLHPQQLILKLITLYSPHSVIFNDFESLFF